MNQMRNSCFQLQTNTLSIYQFIVGITPTLDKRDLAQHALRINHRHHVNHRNHSNRLKEGITCFNPRTNSNLQQASSNLHKHTQVFSFLLESVLGLKNQIRKNKMANPQYINKSHGSYNSSKTFRLPTRSETWSIFGPRHKENIDGQVLKSH